MNTINWKKLAEAIPTLNERRFALYKLSCQYPYQINDEFFDMVEGCEMGEQLLARILTDCACSRESPIELINLCIQRGCDPSIDSHAYDDRLSCILYSYQMANTDEEKKKGFDIVRLLLDNGAVRKLIKLPQDIWDQYVGIEGFAQLGLERDPDIF
jgi:hypothetical protein